MQQDRQTLRHVVPGLALVHQVHLSQLVRWMCNWVGDYENHGNEKLAANKDYAQLIAWAKDTLHNLCLAIDSSIHPLQMTLGYLVSPMRMPGWDFDELSCVNLTLELSPCACHHVPTNANDHAEKVTFHIPANIIPVSICHNPEEFLDWIDSLLLEAETSLASSNNVGNFQDVFVVLRNALAHLRAKKEALGTLGSFQVHLKGLMEPWRWCSWYRLVVEVEVPHI